MKTEIMLALQELTVCTSREDHRKGVIKCDLYVYNYIYEHIEHGDSPSPFIRATNINSICHLNSNFVYGIFYLRAYHF